jgi:hypothetical protein
VKFQNVDLTANPLMHSAIATAMASANRNHATFRNQIAENALAFAIGFTRDEQSDDPVTTELY